MKTSLSLLCMVVLCVALSLSQIGCAGVYAVGDGPVYGPSPVVPLVAWGGAGYYGGTYYRSSNSYYGSPYYRGGSGYYRNSDGWNNNRSGYATGWRGNSASWNRGYGGSASGWRGGSASWGGGSGSWSGARGGSGSWRR